MICTDLLCAAEKESCFACLDHSEIIVGISACDSLKSHGLQCLHSCQLRFLTAHLKACDLSVLCYFQGITEKCRPSKLLHQRSCKLCKGITDQYHLGKRSQLIQKFLCSRKGIDLCNSLLDLFQSQTMFFQNSKSPVHQLIIIRLITGCSLELRDSACLCKCDPDLRYQYTFYVQTCNIHLSYPPLDPTYR